MPSTRQLWDKQNCHVGDRQRLFTAVGEGLSGVERVLYAGSYVDVAPSFVWGSVTYVDVDRRAAKFFADTEGVQAIIAEAAGEEEAARREVAFLHADYCSALPLPEEGFDLLVSLYAGFVSEACVKYLKVGGTLLVNPSHGDVALVSVDERFELVGVVNSARGDYRVSTKGLDDYLVPKKEVDLSKEAIKQRNRGVAYKKSAFAYLFKRVH